MKTQLIDLDKQREEFLLLQNELRERWQTVDLFDRSDADILVIPSVTLDQREMMKIDGVHHYEERLLFSLIRLRNPQTRLVYITSQPLHPSVIDYYLQLLPGIPFSHARERLLLLSTYDASPRPLSEKILERPRLIEKIRQALRPARSFMICYNSTHLEEALSVALNIPLLAAAPHLLYWGTKSGSREIFAECGIPLPNGSKLVKNADDLAEAAAELWEKEPHLQRMVIKLNEGFSGEGNALLDLRKLREVNSANRLQAIREAFPCLRFQSAGETWDNFSSKITELGAIVESFIE